MEEIKIGKQIWMKLNLDVEVFRNGDPIPHAKTDEEWVKAGEQKKPAWCYYKNAGIYGEKYGKLYNWYAVNDPRGLAPKGWHVPCDKEWDELVEYLGGEDEAGTWLKSSHGWEENGHGTDEVGFSGLPGGYRLAYGSFNYIGFGVHWWSTKEHVNTWGDINALSYELNSFDANVQILDFNKGYGFSVRCLKD